MDYILLRRREPKIKYITEDNLPPFIAFDGSSNCMRLIRSKHDDRGLYYRDGGDYQVEIKFINGKIYSWSHIESVNNIRMIEVTMEEWKKSNGHYAPKVNSKGKLI